MTLRDGMGGSGNIYVETGVTGASFEENEENQAASPFPVVL